MAHRSAKTRRTILEAAARAFRRRGFHRTTMRDIAAECDMAVGNLYHHFKNKQALLLYLQEHTLDSLMRRAEAINTLTMRPDTRLYLLITNHIRCLNHDSPGAVAHVEVDDLDETDRPVVVARRRAYEAQFHRLIGEGIGLGILRPTDVKVATFALLGAMNHTTRWYRPEGRLGARAIGIQLAEMLVSGLLAEDQGLAAPTPELVERDFSAAAE